MFKTIDAALESTFQPADFNDIDRSIQGSMQLTLSKTRVPPCREAPLNIRAWKLSTAALKNATCFFDQDPRSIQFSHDLSNLFIVSKPARAFSFQEMH